VHERAQQLAAQSDRPANAQGVKLVPLQRTIDADALRSGRRPLARACLDWTERRPHLAGLAGARICERMLERRWITRIGSGRAVKVTPSGATALRDLLGLGPLQ
jgi:hypothetical protein